MKEKSTTKISRNQKHYTYMGRDIHHNIKERAFMKSLSENQLKQFIKDQDKFFFKNKSFHKEPIELYFKLKDNDVIGYGYETFEIKNIDGKGNMLIELVDDELVDTGETKYVTFVEFTKTYHTSFIDLLYRDSKPYKEVLPEEDKKLEEVKQEDDQSATK